MEGNRIESVEVNEGTIPLFASKLNERGELMKVSVLGLTGWDTSVGTLGYRVSKEAGERLRAQKFALVPQEYRRDFDSASQMAYDAVRAGRDYTLVAFLVGANVFRHVRKDRVPFVKAQVDEAGELFDQARSKLLEDAPKIRIENDALLEEVAWQIVDGLTRTGADIPGGSPEKFVEQFKAHGRARFDQIIARLPEARIILYARKCPLGSEILKAQSEEAAYDAEIARAAEEKRLAEEKSVIEMLRARRLSEELIQQTRMEWQRKADAEEQIRLLEYNTKKEMIREVLNPFYEGLLKLRIKVNQDVQGVLDAFAEKRKAGKAVELSPATAKMLRSVATMYEQSKLVDDGELEKLLAELDAAAIPSTKLRPVDPGRVIAAMEKIVEFTNEAVQEAMRSGRASLVDVD